MVRAESQRRPRTVPFQHNPRTEVDSPRPNVSGNSPFLPGNAPGEVRNLPREVRNALGEARNAPMEVRNAALGARNVALLVSEAEQLRRPVPLIILDRNSQVRFHKPMKTGPLTKINRARERARSEAYLYCSTHHNDYCQ